MCYVCSVLTDMYAKHGNLDNALKILRQLTEEDVVSWTALITGRHAHHEMFEEALKFYVEMPIRGI